VPATVNVAARRRTHLIEEKDAPMTGKRITFALGAALALLTLTLAACGSSSTPTTSGSSINYSGSIVIWHNWQGSYLGEKQGIFTAYHALHPNVTIQLVHQDNVVDKAITSENAGQGPDIIAWVDDSLGKLASSGIIIPMDRYISKSYLESTYNPAAAQGLELNGKVWGVPESVEAVTIMYNKSLVTADQLPKTSDDLVTFNQSYATAHPGSYGIVWSPTDAYFNADWFYGFGAQYVDATGKVSLNTPQGIAAAKFIASLRPALPKNIDYGVADSLFKEGKAAAIINGPWAYSDYAKAPSNVGFALLPTIPSNSSKPAQPFVGVKSLWATKSAANPALVADIMKFYTNTENQIAMAKVNGEIPANLAADNDTSVQALDSVGGFAAQAKLGTALPNFPQMSALWDPVAKALGAIWSGSQTPEAAMASAQTAAETGIANLK
jgi:arabinogalactan oligomer / maltooligosaccharide transport system substrate-binding protein